MEELILYLDREIRFPLRVGFNRFQHNHPELIKLIYVLGAALCLYVIYSNSSFELI